MLKLYASTLLWKKLLQDILFPSGIYLYLLLIF